MELLKEFEGFVKEINSNNSRNYKLDILRKYKDNENIKYFLNYIYNPYIITGISTKKLNKVITGHCMSMNPERSSWQILEYIKENNTGKDDDVFVVQTFKHTVLQDDEILCDLFDKIITKSLTLGIDTKSINKCMGNLIPTFNVQLANKYFDKPEIVEGKEFALTTKIDGGRIIALKHNGKVEFYTRQGQPYEGLVDLEKEMMEKLPDNICLDGEITLLNPWVEGEESFWADETSTVKKLSSKEQYKETMKITRKDGEKHGVKMLVFDCMTAEEFRNQKCDTPYFIRRGDLIRQFSKYYLNECIEDDKKFNAVNFPEGWSKRNDLEAYNEYMFKSRNRMIEFLNTKYVYFNILPILYEGNDTNEITKWLNYNIDRGEEGVMINLLNAPYHFDRTSDLLKVKIFNSCDLKVLNLEEGRGKYQNSLGAFICEYKDNIVKVGTGISDEIRKMVWNDKNKYLDTIIEVGYFEETENQNGTKSLRFPTFKDFRPDKSEPNY